MNKSNFEIFYRTHPSGKSRMRIPDAVWLALSIDDEKRSERNSLTFRVAGTLLPRYVVRWSSSFSRILWANRFEMVYSTENYWKNVRLSPFLIILSSLSWLNAILHPLETNKNTSHFLNQGMLFQERRKASKICSGKSRGNLVRWVVQWAKFHDI